MTSAIPGRVGGPGFLSNPPQNCDGRRWREDLRWMHSIVSEVGATEIAGSLVSNSAETRRHDLLLDRKPQLPRTFNALRLLERDLFAYKLLQFVFGGLPEMLARRISSAFRSIMIPLPDGRYIRVTENSALGSGRDARQHCGLGARRLRSVGQG